MAELDPATQEVIRNALLTTTAEMKVVTQRASHSPVWREAGDLSCAVLDPGGDVIAQGPADLPIHLATMPFSLRGALEYLGDRRLRDGDIVFLNDPEYGNNHLPDCLLLKPVFADGEIVAFVAVRGHWPDIGGTAIGGYSTLIVDPVQEGLRIPPVLLWREGVLDEDLLAIVLANVRGAAERHGDLLAQYAGCVRGATRVSELLAKYGTEVVRTAMRRMLDHSEELMRHQIAQMADGVFEAEVDFDGDGVGEPTLHLRARVEVRGEEIEVDFTGSSDQVAGGLNAPLAVATSAVHCAIQMVADPDTPPNSGCYRSVSVTAPVGSLVNPVLPAPVVAGNTETAARIVEVVLMALGQPAPSRAIAPSCGCSNALFIGGDRTTADGRREQFIYIEVHAGGWGARTEADGINAMRFGVGNAGNTSIELVESEYPVDVLRYELVPDSGGAGRRRGGLGLRRVMQLRSDAEIVVIGDGVLTPFRGLDGGQPGRPARFVVNDGLPTQRELFSKSLPTKLRAGDTITVESPGGGGLGRPADRASADVDHDVAEGYVSSAAAADSYGRTP